ncbi:MAG: cytochrome P450 [Ilumatobacteraceae bacterium]
MVDYDPFGPATLADPFPAYADLRATCPVHRYDGFDPPFFTLSRYVDVAGALRDVPTYSSIHGQGPRWTSQGGLFTDPPAHTAFRRLLQQAFTPRAVAGMESVVAALADDLVAAVAPDGSADLHETLAAPLPTITIATMLGVPPGDRHRFKAWSDAMVASMGSQDPLAFRDERAELEAYLLEHVDRRRGLLARGEPLPADLISALVRAEDGGAVLTPGEIMGSIVQLLVGGNETTTSLITNALVRLMERPALLAQVAADLRLVDAVVEESLRFDAPVLGLFRTTTCPVERHGVEVPADAKVMLLYGSANRDADVFADADEFRLDRPPSEARRHLAFGLGVHFCLGAALARLEARHALRAAIGGLPGLRSTGEPGRIAPFLLWGRRTLPVAWIRPPTRP